MAQDLINNDLHVNGALTAKQFTAPTGSITNTSIAASAGIAATKVEHQFDLSLAQVPGTAVVAETRDIRAVHGATAEVVAFKAGITGAIATGADRTVTIDLHKGNSGSAFATILTAPIVLDNTNTLRTLETAAIASPDLVVGDILRFVVTVAGAAGSQGQGLIISCTIREDAA